MWSRVGDINKLVEKSYDLHAHVKYFPSHFACPITYFSFAQYKNGDITLFIYLARLPGLEDLMRKLKTKKGGCFRKPIQFGASFYQCRVSQQDIDWFVNLMKLINLNFNQQLFNDTIITEVTQVVHWLQNDDISKLPYEHLVSEMTSPAAAYINPGLQESTAMLDVCENFIVKNQTETNAKIRKCLSAGENPNQKNLYHHNPLDRLIHHSSIFRATLTSDQKKKLDSFLADLTVVFICYGLNVYNRQNPDRFSTIEWAVSSSFWSVYDVIVKSASKPRFSQLKLTQKSIDYIENDRIYSELLFPGKHIRTCLMPTQYLRQDEIISLFAVFAKIFETDDDAAQGKILAVFFNDLLRDKNIEIFYHDDRIIGFNLTYFSVNQQRKQIIYHCDYCLLEPEYQQLGLASYTVARQALALQLHLSNLPKWKDCDVVVQCESVSEGSHRVFQHLLYYPKYKTDEVARDAKSFAYKIFDESCRYVETDTTCYIEDEVTLKTASNKTRNFNVFDNFFNLLRGLPRDQSGVSNRSVPIRFFVAKKYLEQWSNQAKKLGGENPEAMLLRYATLLYTTKSFSFLQENAQTAKSFYRAFSRDESLFFQKKRVPALNKGRAIMPASSRL